MRKAQKLAAHYLAYAERHSLVRRIGPHTWTPTVADAVLKVRPREVGYDQAPLVYACNELREMLGDL